MDRAVKISRPGHENNNDEKSLVVKTDDNAPQSFISMQQNMESELERRRRDWEKEVEKMQEDFFQVKIPKSNKSPNANKTIEVRSDGYSSGKELYKKGDIFEIGNAKTIYNERPDGTKVVTFRFDVKGFDPSAITVKAVGNKVTVSAHNEEEHYPGNKNTRRHNRQVDIPPGVDPDNFTSHLSADGILTVEAPVTELPEDEQEGMDQVDMVNTYMVGSGAPELEIEDNNMGDYYNPRSGSYQYQDVENSYINQGPIQYSIVPTSRGMKYRSVSPRVTRLVTKNVHTLYPDGTEYRTTTPGGTVIIRSGSTSSDSLSPKHDYESERYKTSLINTCHPNIITTEEGKRINIVVNLGMNFNPEDITVTVKHKKVSVKALHEENIAGRISKSEFTRDFDIPHEIEPKTVRAVVSRDGKLTIGGSITENRDHDRILSLVLCDMPMNGRACKVRYGDRESPPALTNSRFEVNGDNEKVIVARTSRPASKSDEIKAEMDSVLERRQKEWEDQIEKVQQELFELKPKDNDSDNVFVKEDNKAARRSVTFEESNGYKVLDISNPQKQYIDKPDGRKYIQYKFNVQEFDPKTVKLAIDDNKLNVSACAEQELMPGKFNVRNCSRKVDIPNEVNPDDFTSMLSVDGFLTVQAPVIAKAVNTTKLSNQGNGFDYVNDSFAKNKYISASPKFVKEDYNTNVSSNAKSSYNNSPADTYKVNSFMNGNNRNQSNNNESNFAYSSKSPYGEGKSYYSTKTSTPKSYYSSKSSDHDTKSHYTTNTPEYEKSSYYSNTTPEIKSPYSSKNQEYAKKSLFSDKSLENEKVLYSKTNQQGQGQTNVLKTTNHTEKINHSPTSPTYRKETEYSNFHIKPSKTSTSSENESRDLLLSTSSRNMDTNPTIIESKKKKVPTATLR